MSWLFGGSDSETTSTPNLPPEARNFIRNDLDMMRWMLGQMAGRWLPGYEYGHGADPWGGGNPSGANDPYWDPWDGMGDPKDVPIGDPPGGGGSGGGTGGGGGGTGGGGGGGVAPIGGPVVIEGPYPTGPYVNPDDPARVILGPGNTAPIPPGMPGQVYYDQGNSWIPTIGMTEPTSFFDPVIAPVAGPSGLENWAAGLVPQLMSRPGELDEANALLDQMTKLGATRVTGEGLQQDPAYQAAISAFSNAYQPIIENQAALAGLNRSTAMTNATAKAQAEYMLPTIQDTLNRQERGLQRQLDTLRSGYEGKLGLGDRATDRLRTSIGTGMSIGGVGREIAQQRGDARYNDIMRRMGQFESMFGAPFQLVPNATGETAVSQRGGKK